MLDYITMESQSRTKLVRYPPLRKGAGFVRDRPKNIYVAISGGVDSSVAAVLLKKQGFNVVGVFMKPWSPSATNSKFQIPNSEQIQNLKSKIQDQDFCLWQQDREDALRAASVLGIPLLTWDFSREYKKKVGDYMIQEYKAGRTPNPDVMCNKEIKFSLFLKKALKEGADFIATGHYIRKAEVKKFKSLKVYKLFQAKDKNKDQSYFLWTLTQQQLKHCLFPIGHYTKPEVRKMAKKFGLPNHDKKDSQGVCFVGPLDMKSFLSRYIKNKKGKIVDKNAKVVGEHDGVYYYTIGQRHGLNIGNGKGPYYITGKNIKNNVIFVGEEGDLGGKEAKITHINWIDPTWKLNFQAKGSVEVDVKVRYRARSEEAVLYENGSLKFKSLIRAVTPAQSAVFYRGEELIGGGIIQCSRY